MKLSLASVPPLFVLAVFAAACARPAAPPRPPAARVVAMAPETGPPASRAGERETPLPLPLPLAPSRRHDIDHHAQAERDAATVFRAMNHDLLRCFARPASHAFVEVDVLVGPQGDVRDVEATGGALAGRTAMACLTRRIARATFPPPRGGGTARVRVPFAFAVEPAVTE
jgi:hypothetical protein